MTALARALGRPLTGRDQPVPNSRDRQHTTVLPPAAPFPIIVTIVGPAAATEEINRFAIEQEHNGRIVVVPHVRPSLDFSDVTAWNEIHQARLHELALRKIDIADEVLVVGSDEQLGTTIREQIAYAQGLRKPVHRRVPVLVS